MNAQKEEQKIFKTVSLAVWITITGYSILFISFGAYFSSVSTLMGMFVLTPLGLYFEYKGYSRTARVLFLLSCSLYIYLGSLGVQHQVSAEYYLLPATILPLMIFESKGPRAIVLGLLMPLLSWLLISFGPHSIPGLSDWYAADLPVKGLRTINFLGAYALLVTFVTMYARSFLRRQVAALAEEKKVKETIQEAFNKLMKSEEALSEAQSAAKIGFWVYDPINDSSQLTSELYKIFSLGENTVTPPKRKEFLKIVHPGDRALVIKAIQNCYQKAQAFSLRYRVLQSDNSFIWVETRATAKKSETGGVVSLLGTIQDISSTVEAEEKMSSNEKFLSNLFQNMVEGVVIQDSSSKVLRFNEAALSILGMSADELLGKVSGDPKFHLLRSDGSLLPRDQAPANLALKTNTRQSGVVGFKNLITGTRRWIQVNSVPLVGAQNSATHVITTFVDITEIRKSEQLLYQTVNSTPDWIFIKDRDHRYLTVNDSYAKALHKKAGEFIGKTDLDLGFPETLVKGDPSKGIRGFWSDDDLVLNTGKLQVFDNDPAMIDGKIHTFHTIKAPIFESGEEKPYAVLGFARDITNLKEVEEQLIQASKLASLGMLAGGIAHEINNPLAIIHGKANQLSRSLNLGAPEFSYTHALETVNKILSMVDRISKIIKGLKTFSRNGEDDHFELVSIQGVIEDSLALCADRMRRNGILVELALIPQVKVMGSAAQLSQVLINLLSNSNDAIESLPEKWIKINCALIGESQIEMSVSDSGQGIPVDIVKKMMLPFYTTKEVGKGTGLGLSISKTIIEKHGGKLYLDSQARNTRFVIELPARPESKPEISPENVPVNVPVNVKEQNQ